MDLSQSMDFATDNFIKKKKKKTNLRKRISYK